MSAVLDDKAERLLVSWGLGGLANERLTAHADNVLRYKGRSVEQIIVALGILDQAELDRYMAQRAHGASVLQHLRQIRAAGLSTRAEELHCIEAGVAFVAQKMPSMQLHELIKNKSMLMRIQEELTLREVLPMRIAGTQILAFRTYEQLLRFNMMGKAEKHASELIKALASANEQRAEQAVFYTVVLSETLYITYQQQLTDISQGAEVSDDAIQSITHAEGDRDAVMKQLVNIFEMALRDDVNDVAVVPNRSNGRARVFFRKNQQLTNSNIELSSTDREAVTRMLLARSKANPSGARLRKPADGNLNYVGRTGQAFMRLSFLPLEESSLPATSISIRIFPKSERKISLSNLHIAPDIIKELNYLAERSYGLFVVCGPTGSGKSTTIAGMLGHHYDMFGDSKKRISVEQPCERILPGVQHIDVSQHHYQETQVANGEPVDKFAMALRAILRHDPDLIFVGEVRDRESCMVSIDSANTGHLVFTTTHANDPVLGYRRLASFLDEERRFDLVNVLEGILAQRLLPLICPHCSEQMPFTEREFELLQRYARANGVDLDNLDMPATHGVIKNHEGCSKCTHGLATMVPVHGLLTMNPDVRNLLLSPNSADYLRAQEASDSQATLFGSAFHYFKNGQAQLGSILL